MQFHRIAISAISPVSKRLLDMFQRFSIRLFILLLVGCGGPGEVRPDLQPVTGSLQINGKPAVGARLFFHPDDGQDFDQRGTRPSAKVDEAGEFALSTYQPGDGIPVGEYRIGIIWMNNEASSSPQDQLGGRYANPKTSKITATITPETTRLDPIELMQVPVKPPARSRAGANPDGDE